jgi:hypothetical protein
VDCGQMPVQGATFTPTEGLVSLFRPSLVVAE